MRQMKNSGIEWVGDIPDNWNVNKTKYNFQYKKEIAGTKCKDYDRLALTMNNVVKRSKDDNSGLQPKEFETYQIIRQNELVFKLIDLQNVSTSRVGLSPYVGLVSPAYIILRATGKVLPPYAEKYFYVLWKNQIFNSLGDDGVRSNLGKEDLLNIPMPIPPIEEQERIAEFLDKKCGEIDGLIADIKIQVQTLEQYKRSVITEAVTKGLNPSAEMKDSEIEWVGDIPANWDIHPLYYFFDERKNKNSFGKENNLLSLSYGKIIRKDINSNGGLLPENFNGYNIVEPNDIVLRLTDLQNDKRSLRTGFVKERGIITSAYVALKAKVNILPEFFYYELHVYDLLKVLYNLGNGVRQGLNYSELSKLKLFAPDLSEQQEIVNYIREKESQVDELISTKQSQIEALESYKKSLIYEYVTGKKEVV